MGTQVEAVAEKRGILGAVGNPAATYERPFDVVLDMTLTQAEKAQILRRWLDVVSQQRSEQSGELYAVIKALKFLGCDVPAPSAKAAEVKRQRH